MDTGVVYLYYYESSAYKWEILLHSFYENGEYESLLKRHLKTFTQRQLQGLMRNGTEPNEIMEVSLMLFIRNDVYSNSCQYV